MIRDRILAHYEALGWTRAAAKTVGVGLMVFEPDLVLEKGDRTLAVKVSEETLGSFQIGVFGAQCRRARVSGLVVCEPGPDVLEACENAKLDFLSSADVGTPIVLRAPTRPPIVAPAPVPQPLDVLEPTVASSRQPIPFWRWAIVGVIWLLAALAWATLLMRIG